MAIPDYIIHPDLAFTRCVTEHGRIVREEVPIGRCHQCDNNCAKTGWPGVRWLVRGFRLEAGKPVRIPGKHLVCQECLILWDE
jgi:hypothetical protein